MPSYQEKEPRNVGHQHSGDDGVFGYARVCASDVDGYLGFRKRDPGV